MTNITSKSHHRTFTLIEITIAFCIILMVLCTIFLVKQISRESDVKSLIMQIKKYDAALTSFTQKYHALPGDIQGTMTYGITENNTDGNDDNVITDHDDKIIKANGEIVNFWLHLSKSKMIDEIYDGAENEKVEIGHSIPISKIGDKIGIIAFGAEGKTFFQIGFDYADNDRLYTTNRSLNTEEALLLDKKIDDGYPEKGRVVAAGSNSLNVLKNNECVKFSEYDLNISEPSCQIRIEAK